MLPSPVGASETKAENERDKRIEQWILATVIQPATTTVDIINRMTLLCQNEFEHQMNTTHYYNDDNHHMYNIQP